MLLEFGDYRLAEGARCYHVEKNGGEDALGVKRWNPVEKVSMSGPRNEEEAMLSIPVDHLPGDVRSDQGRCEVTEDEKKIYTMGMIDGLRVAASTARACAVAVGFPGGEKVAAAMTGLAGAFDDKVDAETKKAGL